MHLLQSTNAQPIFFFIKIFHLFSIGKKEREKWKKTIWNTSGEKKIRKENKTKKIKLTNKRNTVVLRTSKYENNNDGD